MHCAHLAISTVPRRQFTCSLPVAISAAAASAAAAAASYINRVAELTTYDCRIYIRMRQLREVLQ